MIAHIGPVPVEEVLPALTSGIGAWLFLRLTALRTRSPSSRAARTTAGQAGRGGAIEDIVSSGAHDRP